MRVQKLSEKTMSAALAALKRGEVVLCPTDTVYGFLADASNKKTVDKIYKLKKRPRSKPLPVFVKDFAMASAIAEIDEKQAKILKKFWPGKYTFVLQRKPGVKVYTTAKKIPIAKQSRILDEVGTIAIRIPKHAFLQRLLKKIHRPLVQTSVNISNQAPMSHIQDIIDTFGKNNILIIDAGNLKKSKPSTITDLTSKKPKKLR